MTYEDFKDWKSNPVTKQISAGLEARIDDLKDTLATSAGVDSLHDRFLAGYIQATRDFLDIKLEEIAND